MKNEELTICLTGSEPTSFPDHEEKPGEPEKKSGIEKSYPGILEEGLVYSCAGPRIDFDEA